MSPWSDVFLGIIAVATLAIAIAQIAVIVVAARLARRVQQLADQIDHQVKPLFVHLDAIGRDAARGVALAAQQVERADRVFADLAMRLERMLDTAQTAIGTPVREGRALVSAFKAVIQALRDAGPGARGRSRRSEEDDALFI